MLGSNNLNPATSVAHRQFTDSIGRTWDAWEVTPEFAERRTTPPAPWLGVERRQRAEFRVPLGKQWSKGWLAFETRGEKRRLAPVPPGWSALTDRELAELCDSASRARSQSGRLIE